MTFDDVLESLRTGFQRSFESQDWERFTVNQASLSELFLDAKERGADDEIVKLGELAREFYDDIIATYDLDIPRDATWAVLQLLGASRVIATAIENRKSLTSEQEEIVTSKAALDILRILNGSSAKPNLEIAGLIAQPEETVARTMPALRHAQLIRSWSAGRRRVSAITPKGRQAIGVEPVLETVPAPPQPGWFVKLQHMSSARPGA